jgi:homospermidine synthase
MNLDQRRRHYLGDELYERASYGKSGVIGVSKEELELRARIMNITLEELKSNISCFGNIRYDLGDKHIFQIGLGGIGGNILEFYTRHLTFKSGNIVVCDKQKSVCESMIGKYEGITIHNIHVVKENYKEVYSKFLRRGDILVDLGYYVDTLDTIKWCKDNGVFFVNAAVEEWESTSSNDLQYPKNDARTYTLYNRQMLIQQETKGWKNTPTAILTIGANPGVVSYLSKIGMVHWVNRLKKINSKWKGLDKALKIINTKPINYPELSKLLDIQVIQITEKDTLRQSIPRKEGEFICTWSPQGFIEEGIATAELGWGTHETMTEKEGALGYKKGPKNQVCFPKRGVDTLVEAYVPSGNYVGFLVRHEEAFSISDYLTVKKGGEVYRPTVYYAYYPCSDAVASVYEMRSNGYKQPDSLRLPKKELIDGLDELGCFMLSGNKELGSWWIGTVQSVDDANELCPGQSPTTLVVTAGVFTGILYALKHPNLGVIHPEEMNVEESLDITLPYWYPLKSFMVKNWEPKVQSKFYVNGKSGEKESEDWIIEKFLV